MTAIDEKFLQRLEKAGLYVSNAFPQGHMWQFGVRVAKPTSTPGNCIPDYHFKCGDVPINAPALIIYPTHGEWAVMAQECVPAPGPGDFEHRWSNLEDAVEDILDFYLGD